MFVNGIRILVVIAPREYRKIRNAAVASTCRISFCMAVSPRLRFFFTLM